MFEVMLLNSKNGSIKLNVIMLKCWKTTILYWKIKCQCRHNWITWNFVLNSMSWISFVNWVQVNVSNHTIHAYCSKNEKFSELKIRFSANILEENSDHFTLVIRNRFFWLWFYQSFDEEYLIYFPLKRRLTDKNLINKQQICPALVNAALQKLTKIKPFCSNITNDNEWERFKRAVRPSDMEISD